MAGERSCWGVDLSGSPWPCVASGPGKASTPAGDPPAPIPGPDLVAETEAILRPSPTGDPTRPVVEDWPALREFLRQARNPIRPRLPEAGLVGVAYPRTMPPLLRRNLPILFGGEPASPRGGLPADSPLVGVEAPVALLLEALAREAVTDPGTYAVGCGLGPSLEWTALSVAVDRPGGDASPRPLLRIGLGMSSSSLEDLQLRAPTVLWASEAVGGLHGIDPSRAVRLEPTAVASGAARFAEWLTLELSHRPTAIDRRRQSALLPRAPILSDRIARPVGLIGNDGRGHWYWRRLLDPGAAIPSGRLVLCSNTPPPCWFLLAETLDPKACHSRWLTQEEWPDAGLRWHSTIWHPGRAEVTPPIRWTLELRDLNDHRVEADGPRDEVPPRWGLPNWICRISADTPP